MASSKDTAFLPTEKVLIFPLISFPSSGFGLLSLEDNTLAFLDSKHAEQELLAFSKTMIRRVGHYNVV